MLNSQIYADFEKICITQNLNLKGWVPKFSAENFLTSNWEGKSSELNVWFWDVGFWRFWFPIVSSEVFSWKPPISMFDFEMLSSEDFTFSPMLQELGSPALYQLSINSGTFWPRRHLDPFTYWLGCQLATDSRHTGQLPCKVAPDKPELLWCAAGHLQILQVDDGHDPRCNVCQRTPWR